MANGATGPLVLIVEDNEDKRFLLRRILDTKFRVIEAENGPSALGMIVESPPDVVLLDVLLPGMDGFEVCRRLKSNPSTAEVPILFVSVLDPDQHVVAGLELGAEDFISWPVNATELVARIGARIRSRRPILELRNMVHEQSRMLEDDRRREAETEFELEQAQRVQHRFMSTDFPQARGLRFAHQYRPSRMVGGDIFDVIAVERNELYIIMADVSGHGLAAALIMSVTKVLFRTGAEQARKPEELLQWLNRQIASYLATGEFLTAFIGLWNSQTQVLSYTGAGHPPTLVFSPGGEPVRRLRVSSGVIGLDSGAKFSAASMKLGVGDRIVCYTDGITEAMNDAAVLFGEAGLIAACQRSRDYCVSEMVRHIFQEVDDFSRGQPRRDDQALLVAEVTAE
jgi:sigma-B regulation protein RsbU (phosphoserine phosphatase)